MQTEVVVDHKFSCFLLTESDEACCYTEEGLPSNSRHAWSVLYSALIKCLKIAESINKIWQRIHSFPLQEQKQDVQTCRFALHFEFRWCWKRHDAFPIQTQLPLPDLEAYRSCVCVCVCARCARLLVFVAPRVPSLRSHPGACDRWKRHHRRHSSGFCRRSDTTLLQRFIYLQSSNCPLRCCHSNPTTPFPPLTS